jgi:glycosyltransferase involved in cell wall biosynthesis
MRVALVHDWLTGMRGGEKVLESFLRLHPEADLFTLVWRPGSVSSLIEDRRIITSSLQRVPGARKHYRYLLPLMPAAVEAFDLSAYDLVISSSHCVAKGVIPRPDALHLAYLHTPMRYIWDLAPLYFPPRGILGRYVLPHVLRSLRQWDVSSSARVDRFIANSRFVAQRIEKYYRRSSVVVHPPVDTDFFHCDRPPGRGYLMVSALVPSKGIELAIEAFDRLALPLRIVGQGPLERALRRRAGPTIEFLGRLSAEDLRKAYADCAAVVHTAVEDFGIVALEANACGRAVIALARGGSLETVRTASARPPEVHTEGDLAPAERYPTGILFDQPTSEDLAAAVLEFEARRDTFEPDLLRQHALGFDREVFEQRMRAITEVALAERRRGTVGGTDDRSSVDGERVEGRGVQ